MPDTIADKQPSADASELADPELSHEPPPPTVSDRPPPPKPPSRVRGCVVAAAVAATLIGAAAAFVYFYVWRYEPTARQHIPDGAVVAARLEAADVVLFAPVRKHLWPLLDPSAEGAPPAPGAKPKPSRVARIADLTGVHLARDVREIAFAMTDPRSWVVLVGGNLDRGRFVKGIAKLFQEDGTEGWSEVGELLVGPGGLTIGQADDGTIVLGTNPDVARAALPATDAYEDLELPEQGAVVFAVTHRAWKGIAQALPQGTPRADVLAGIRHGGGRLVLGDAPSVELRVRSATEQDAALMAADIEALVGTMRLATLLTQDRWGEKEALSATTVTAEAWSVVLRAPWPMAGLDRACEDLAAAITQGQALSR